LTGGQVATYHGRLIQAYFHSSSGGHTESNANVWGGAPLPYLHGVCDPGDYTSANPNRAWSVSMTGAAVGERVRRETGHRIGSAVLFTGVTRTPSGRIAAATVVGSNGRVRVSGDTLAAALGLRDTKVWIDVNRNVRRPLRHRYDALGCGPGMPDTSQVHTHGVARQRFSRGTLYHVAKRHRTYWLYGGIERAYVDRHETAGVLGPPRSDVERIRGCARCLRALFDRGAIYSKPGAGLHVLFGRVVWAYFGHGGTSTLGVPTSGIRSRGRTTSATFEHGSIKCPRSGRCVVRRR
jgi:hypothetical protein